MKVKVIHPERTINSVENEHELLLTLTNGEYRELLKLCEQDQVSIAECIASALMYLRRINKYFWSE